MAILAGATFSGVQDQTGAPQQPITAAQLRNIAKDHGLIYELLTNKKADLSGAAPAVAGHKHIEAGNLLYWPISTVNFDAGAPATDATGTNQFHSPAGIFDAVPTAQKDVVVFLWPIFIPAAFAGKSILVGIESYGTEDPNLFATLETWGTVQPPAAGNNKYGTATPVTGSNRVPLLSLLSTNATTMVTNTGDANTAYVAEVVPAVSGLHVVRITTDISGDRESGRLFGSAFVWPLADVAGELVQGKQTKPTILYSSSIAVGDPDGAVNPDLFPVDDTLVADFDNMGIAVMANHINSAILEEWATGLPVFGNTAITVAKGHDHSNPGSAPWYGAPVEFCLASFPKGTIETNTALRGRIKAPQVPSTATATTFRLVDDFELYTPVFAGASKLFCAVMTRHDTSKTCGIEVRVTATPSGGGAASVTLASTVTGGAGYELCVHGTALPFQSGGAVPCTQIQVEIRGTANSSGDTPAYMGICLFFDHH